MTPLALRYMGDGEFRALHPRLADKAWSSGGPPLGDRV